MRGVLFSILGMLIVSTPVFASGWLQIGERCVPGSTFDDPDGECINQAYCYHESGSDFGACIENCSEAPLFYTTISTGYWSRRCADCEIAENCPVKTVYSCAMGWYGVTTDGKTGCTKCPAVAGISNIQSIPWTAPDGSNNHSITDCFILGGGSSSDETGSFEIASMADNGDGTQTTSKCYYSN